MAFVQKGLKNILQKNPNDVVILSALRTPVTRAKKGGLRDAYDHELLGAVRSSLGQSRRSAKTSRSSKPRFKNSPTSTPPK